MAKRTLRAEPKKECPSCGLGVSPESTICEFCGWNFEEEDEWILQIEKLERDLMLEKQKYEPGTVDHMLESTLRSPLLDRVESSVPKNEGAMEVEEAVPEYEEPAEEEAALKEAAEEPVQEEPAMVQPAVPRPEASKVRKVRSVKPSPAPVEEEVRKPETKVSMPIRKVKTMPQRRVRAPAPEEERPEEPEEDVRPVRRTRAVRRVKRQ